MPFFVSSFCICPGLAFVSLCRAIRGEYVSVYYIRVASLGVDRRSFSLPFDRCAFVSFLVMLIVFVRCLVCRAMNCDVFQSLILLSPSFQVPGYCGILVFALPSSFTRRDVSINILIFMFDFSINIVLCLRSCLFWFVLIDCFSSIAYLFTFVTSCLFLAS